MNTKTIYIVIVNWNRPDLTITCIQSVLKSIKTSNQVQIIVVDNNSTDNSVQLLKKLRIPFKLIQNKINLGWAGGNNMGIKYALQNKINYILLLNNDVVLEKNCIQNLIKKIHSDSKIGIVGPKTYFPQKRPFVIADAGGIITKPRFFGNNRGIKEVDKGQYDKQINVDFISGSTMLIKKEVFNKIGFFDERFFLYYEDADFCFRARNNGFKVTYMPSAVVYHDVGSTTKLGSPLHIYYTTRNHLLFLEKHAPVRVKLREWLRTPKTAYEFLLNKDEIKGKYSLLGIRDYYLRRFGKRKYW